MIVLATPMRDRGRARAQHDIQTATPVQGDLVVAQSKPEIFGRYSTVASFHQASSNEAPLLPPLHDAVLTAMGTNGFVLTGVELVDGLAYAQSWWCRPLR